MKMTINFREELEMLPVDISFMLKFEETGIVHREYYRVNKNFLRQLQYVDFKANEPVDEF